MRSNNAQQFKIGMLRQGATRMSCQNANCEAERKGWVTPLDPMGNKAHAEYARLIEQICEPYGHPHPDTTRRRYIKLTSAEAGAYLALHGGSLGISSDAIEIARRAPAGTFLYVFPPGQQCFRPHLDREVVFVKQKPRVEPYVHVNPRDFNEDMNETADRAGVLRKREGIDEIKQELERTV